MADEPRRLGKQYESLMLNRTLLTWTHVALVLLVAAAYLNQLYFRSLPFLGGVGGRAVLFALIPPSFPYLVSWIHSRRLVGQKRIKVGVFIVFLIGTTATILMLLLGSLGTADWVVLLAIFVSQTIAYVWAANIIFGSIDGF